MKAFAFLCLLFLVGAQADTVKVVETPSYYRGILEILVDLTQTIGRFLATHDPLSTAYFQLDTEILGIVRLGFSVENLAFAGFSDVQILRSEFTGDTLALDIAFVNVWVSTDLFRVFLGSAVGELSGSIALGNLGFSTDLHLDTSNGVSLVDFDLTMKTPTVSAAVVATALGKDYTDFLMELFNERIPAWIAENGSDVGDTIRAIIWRIIKSIQDNS